MTDTERLDFLERKNSTGYGYVYNHICRTDKGWAFWPWKRTVKSLRAAIDAAKKAIEA